MDAVIGIRGPYWQGREEAGRRRSYRPGAQRDGAVTVTREFFDLLRDETCARWLDHLHDQDDLREHTGDLPAWIRSLPKSVKLKTDPEDGARYFARRPCRDETAGVAAAVLGVSVRSVYRAAAEGRPDDSA